MINAKTPHTRESRRTTATTAAPARKPMDILLFWVTWLLLGIGIVTVYDASYTFSIVHHKGDSFYMVKRQAISMGVGLCALVFMRWFRYERWKNLSVFAVAIAMILLMVVYVPHVSILSGGGRRWIPVGPGQFQPSEFAKFALIIYLARVTATRPELMSDFRLGLLPPLAVTLLLGALILHEPDLGTAIVLVATGLTMLLLAGAQLKQMAALAGAAMLIAGVYVLISPMRMARVHAYFNPEMQKGGDAYQVWHSLAGMGSGGLWGHGLGESREKLFMPMAYSDFIFPVFAEEWGLIGAIVLIALLGILSARGYAIMHRTKDPFGMLVAGGITTMISVQAILNIAVATSSVPNTGITLPFISFGGSSLVLVMACVGLLLNISSYPDGPNAAVKDESADDEASVSRSGVVIPLTKPRRPAKKH